MVTLKVPLPTVLHPGFGPLFQKKGKDRAGEGCTRLPIHALLTGSHPWEPARTSHLLLREVAAAVLLLASGPIQPTRDFTSGT